MKPENYTILDNQGGFKCDHCTFNSSTVSGMLRHLDSHLLKSQTKLEG